MFAVLSTFITDVDSEMASRLQLFQFTTSRTACGDWMKHCIENEAGSCVQLAIIIGQHFIFAVAADSVVQ